MNAIVQRLVGQVTAPLREAGQRLVRQLVLGLVAVLLLGLMFGFLIAALYLWLATIEGPLNAALLVAGFFFLLLVIVGLIMMVGGQRRPKPEVRVAAPKVTVDTTSSPTGATWRPLIDAVGKAGFRREQLALLAGSEFGKQLRPVHLLALAFLGGLIAGRRIDKP